MMYFSKILTVLLFVLGTSLFGQELTIIDSLQRQVKLEKTSEAKAKLYNTIGFEYYKTQIYFDSAFFYTEKAYEIAKDHNLEGLQAHSLFNLGSIHSTINEFEASISYYQKARIVIENLGLQGSLNSVLNNIGGAYFELAQYDTAISYYKQALSIAKQLDDPESIGVDYMNIGEAYLKKGQLDESKKNLELALATIESIPFDPPTVHLFYARTLQALNEVEKAKDEGHKSLELAEQEGDKYYISESSLLLSNLYEAQGDFENAFQYHKQHVTNLNSLNLAKEMNEIEKLKLNFELNKQQETLAYLSQKNKYLNIIFVLIGVGLLLLVVLIFRQRKIVRMTKNIHDIQKRLVGNELDEREWRAENPNASSFDASL